MNRDPRAGVAFDAHFDRGSVVPRSQASRLNRNVQRAIAWEAARLQSEANPCAAGRGCHVRVPTSSPRTEQRDSLGEWVVPSLNGVESQAPVALEHSNGGEVGDRVEESQTFELGREQIPFDLAGVDQRLHDGRPDNAVVIVAEAQRVAQFMHQHRLEVDLVGARAGVQRQLRVEENVGLADRPVRTPIAEDKRHRDDGLARRRWQEFGRLGAGRQNGGVVVETADKWYATGIAADWETALKVGWAEAVALVEHLHGTTAEHANRIVGTIGDALPGYAAGKLNNRGFPNDSAYVTLQIGIPKSLRRTGRPFEP